MVCTISLTGSRERGRGALLLLPPRLLALLVLSRSLRRNCFIVVSATVLNMHSIFFLIFQYLQFCLNVWHVCLLRFLELYQAGDRNSSQLF